VWRIRREIRPSLLQRNRPLLFALSKVERGYSTRQAFSKLVHFEGISSGTFVDIVTWNLERLTQHSLRRWIQTYAKSGRCMVFRPRSLARPPRNRVKRPVSYSGTNMPYRNQIARKRPDHRKRLCRGSDRGFLRRAEGRVHLFPLASRTQNSASRGCHPSKLDEPRMARRAPMVDSKRVSEDFFTDSLTPDLSPRRANLICCANPDV
jgi:hypothetical protein